MYSKRFVHNTPKTPSYGRLFCSVFTQLLTQRGLFAGRALLPREIQCSCVRLKERTPLHFQNLQDALDNRKMCPQAAADNKARWSLRVGGLILR